MDCDLSFALLLKDISDDGNKCHIQSEWVPNWNATFTTIIVHTQAVVWCANPVTEASG